MIRSQSRGTGSLYFAIIAVIALLTLAALVAIGGGDGRNAIAQTGVLEPADPDPNGSGTIYQLAVDTNITGNPVAPSGTGSNQLAGPINPCIDGAPVDTVGDTFDVDFIIDEVNPAQDTSGGQFDLTYDGTKLQINAYVIPTQAIDFTVINGTTDPPLPDNSGAATPSWGKFGATPDGEIVFFRITFQVLALGTSILNVENAIMVPGPGVGTIPVQNVFDGEVRAGGTCPAAVTTGTFTVSKDFSDKPGTDTTTVSVSVTCTNGATPDASPKNASEAAPAAFTITMPGGPANCTATEGTAPVGYTKNETACADVAIVANGDAPCTIVNTLNSATFTVNKDFTDKPGTDTTTVSVTLACSQGTIVG
ncbi:MAG: hypothetical protein WD904_05080, partial [Dehalococcoidia bacterium]